MRRRIITITITALLIAFGLGFWWFSRSGDSSRFTSVAQPITSFVPYYFAAEVPGQFTLVADSVKYENNVLIFELLNLSTKKTLSITEQALPDDYDVSSLVADKDFTTTYGKGMITDGQMRTTGTLFTSDKTWVLINAPSPIGGTLMQSVIEQLKPIH